mgnify:CR=1 FL=1
MGQRSLMSQENSSLGIGRSQFQHSSKPPSTTSPQAQAQRRCGRFCSACSSTRRSGITGSSGHSYLDVAQALSQLSGQPIPYHDANPDAFTQRLEGIGLPEFLVHLTVDTVLDIRDHQYEVHSDALRQLLGREPAGLQAMVQEVFGPKPGGQ